MPAGGSAFHQAGLSVSDLAACVFHITGSLTSIVAALAAMARLALTRCTPHLRRCPHVAVHVALAHLRTDVQAHLVSHRGLSLIGPRSFQSNRVRCNRGLYSIHQRSPLVQRLQMGSTDKRPLTLIQHQFRLCHRSAVGRAARAHAAATFGCGVKGGSPIPHVVALLANLDQMVPVGVR